MKKIRKLTHSKLLKLFAYNPETGVFTWKVRRSGTKGLGSIAGGVNHGYRYITCDSESIPAHHLAWFYIHKWWPSGAIDHINRIKDDNWINNLRPVSDSENMQNCSLTNRNKFGVPGIRLHRKNHIFVAYITNNNRYKHLGSTTNFDEAVCYRLAGEQACSREKWNTNTPTFDYVQRLLGKRIRSKNWYRFRGKAISLQRGISG